MIIKRLWRAGVGGKSNTTLSVKEREGQLGAKITRKVKERGEGDLETMALRGKERRLSGLRVRERGSA